MFKAIVISKLDEKQSVEVKALAEAELPEASVSVDVDYSTINYKDALTISGAAPLVRKFPMVPGIDLSGVVSDSSHSAYKAGDKVVLNGWGVGENHWGGLAQKARVEGEWLIPLPDVFSTRQAMAIGTAGYTAALCVDALVDHGIRADMGPILVTGASGGVGSVAISLLARAGFEVVACTGKTSEFDYLKALGAAEMIARSELESPGKPLQKERWAGVVDSLGSHALVNACAQTRYGGAVAACGLAQGGDLPATVMPFILRGVALLGIDSVMAPTQKRLRAWDRLARDFEPDKLDLMAREISLSDVIAVAPKVLEGKIKGRMIVNVNDER
jgi:acrylyl-CoA reductase (NADPH)